MIDRCIAVFALLLSGAILAFMYLIFQKFFWVVVVVGGLQIAWKFRLWWRLPAEKRHEYSDPGRLMNYNHSLAVRAEWIVLLFGFFGTVFWLEFAAVILA